MRQGVVGTENEGSIRIPGPGSGSEPPPFEEERLAVAGDAHLGAVGRDRAAAA